MFALLCLTLVLRVWLPFGSIPLTVRRKTLKWFTNWSSKGLKCYTLILESTLITRSDSGLSIYLSVELWIFLINLLLMDYYITCLLHLLYMCILMLAYLHYWYACSLN